MHIELSRSCMVSENALYVVKHVFAYIFNLYAFTGAKSSVTCILVFFKQCRIFLFCLK